MDLRLKTKNGKKEWSKAFDALFALVRHSGQLT